MPQGVLGLFHGNVFWTRVSLLSKITGEQACAVLRMPWNGRLRPPASQTESRSASLAPIGAAENSQGREPRGGHAIARSQAPIGATEGSRRILSPLSGLGWLVGERLQGLTPLAILFRPLRGWVAAD